ncbi:MAG: FAD-dependent hydroxylase [Cyanobacteria bacterium P01_A01_bin.15]
MRPKLSIAVVEVQSEQQVSDRDRAYALSPLSAKIFQEIGIWEQIAHAICHFSRVVLSDENYPHRVEFTPADVGEPAVYYCAEHRIVHQALQRQLAASSTVTCSYETHLQALHYGAKLAEVLVKNTQGQQRLLAPLVVAADGANSWVRQQAGIKTKSWIYGQACITTVVSPARDHQNVAYEKFWCSGPFAILPLPHNRCQVVWIVPCQEANAIASLPPKQFIAAMQQRYGDHDGPLQLLSQPLVFPARLMHSYRYCQTRLALLGDAAHGCHPVGGQGLNMGIRDAALLSQVLQTAQQKGEDLGDLAILNRYGHRRRLENSAILLFTNLLNHTFSNRWWPLVIARRGLLQLMIAWAPLRRLILQLMTGLWGKQMLLSDEKKMASQPHLLPDWYPSSSTQQQEDLET